MDCSLSVSSVHGIFQTRVLEWVAIAFSSSLLMKERNVLKLRMAPGPPIHKMYFGIILAPDKSSGAMELIGGQITIQIISATQISRTISEYNILVCQVGSEPLGGTDLKTESGVNA